MFDHQHREIAKHSLLKSCCSSLLGRAISNLKSSAEHWRRLPVIPFAMDASNTASTWEILWEVYDEGIPNPLNLNGTWTMSPCMFQQIPAARSPPSKTRYRIALHSL